MLTIKEGLELWLLDVLSDVAHKELMVVRVSRTNTTSVATVTHTLIAALAVPFSGGPGEKKIKEKSQTMFLLMVTLFSEWFKVQHEYLYKF